MTLEKQILYVLQLKRNSKLYAKIGETQQDLPKRIAGFGFGGTYIGNIPALRIDYIWHDKKLGSSNFVVYNENLSDHKAISAEIIIP